MAVPLDAIRAIHNAFRKDMTAIYAAAHIAAGGHGVPDLVLERYTFFKEVLTPVTEVKVLIINWRRIIISSKLKDRCDPGYHFLKLKCS